MKKLAVVIGIIIVICVIFTSLIVVGLTKKGSKEETVFYENAYITECTEKQITFLHDKELHTFLGTLESDYRGLADVEIKNQKITKVYAKQEWIEGVLQSYNEEQIEVEGYGYLPRAEKLKVYSDYNNQIKEIEPKDLIVGSSNLQYIMANDMVCGIIKKEATNATNIRVLLKNQDSIYYNQIFVKGTLDWKLDSVVQSSNTYIDVIAYMNEHSLQKVIIDGGDGLLHLCDENGASNGNTYEGKFIIRREEDGFVLVNELPIEDYVRYVLPSEMPDSFSAEALKAQAVCARTFAYSQMKNATYASYGANLDDSTAYQVYNSAGSKKATDRAVRETVGEVITANNELITCYYFSTSPGFTTDMQVWQSETPLYIKKQNTTMEENLDLTTEEAFLEFINETPNSYDKTSPFYRWDATLDISNTVDESYGQLKNVTVSERNSSGYVTALTITYENGSVRMNHENEIRQFLGTYLNELVLSDGSKRTNFSMIPSACFAVTNTSEDCITLRGGGFGHGIGMSQYGADAMGDAGMNYKEIIKQYYENVEVVKMSGIDGF